MYPGSEGLRVHEPHGRAGIQDHGSADHRHVVTSDEHELGATRATLHLIAHRLEHTTSVRCHHTLPPPRPPSPSARARTCIVPTSVLPSFVYYHGLGFGTLLLSFGSRQYAFLPDVITLMSPSSARTCRTERVGRRTRPQTHNCITLGGDDCQGPKGYSASERRCGPTRSWDRQDIVRSLRFL